MKNNIVALVATIAAIGFGTVARAEVLQNESIDFTGFEVNVPCADGGVGEDVLFTGNLHLLFAVTLDGKGGFHIRSHAQPQGLRGVGLSTGDKFQATGVTQSTEFDGKVGSTVTFINNFKIIGQGPGNNFLIHENSRVTVNANGDVTITHDHFTTECK